MCNVNLRIVMLKDCLHMAGLPPLTEHFGNDENEETHYRVFQTEQVPWLSLVGTRYAELEPVIKSTVRDVIQSRVASSLEEGSLTWTPPVTWSRAMKMTLENRMKRRGDGRKGPLSSVVFRSTECYHGTARYDNVKVAVETDGYTRMYFGRCMMNTLCIVMKM